jgi:hypothetical protein
MESRITAGKKIEAVSLPEEDEDKSKNKCLDNHHL